MITAVRLRSTALMLLLLGCTAVHAQGPAPMKPAAAASPSGTTAATFATVGSTVITVADYERALAVATRKKYYHAKPPEAELAKFQREVGDDLVNRVLLLAEAKARGVQPDRERIQMTVAGYDAQYGKSATWKTQRETMLANVVPQLENDSRLERLEKLVRTVPEPSDAQARAYYEQHRDQFIEPEQVKLAVIMLKVEPSSKQAVWDAAQAESQRIHAKLASGAAFDELARLHSGDRSSAQGGAMEYMHRGMLPAAVQVIVDKLEPGKLAEPVQLLEGFAILRLDGRKQAQQRRFEDVRERAGDLWQRERGDARWNELLASLRRAATIRVDESRYLPISPSAPGPAPTSGGKARAG
jgi:parvulin-like peptidyl-prolyl isomerase